MEPPFPIFSGERGCSNGALPVLCAVIGFQSHVQEVFVEVFEFHRIAVAFLQSTVVFRKSTGLSQCVIMVS